MAMWKLIGLGLALALTGCAGDGNSDDEGTIHEGLREHCPDPTVGCTMTNGTGVYYSEDGYAGIDSWRLMITRFVNGAGTVSFQGRYYDATQALWLPITGTLRSASYKSGKSLKVQSLAEKGTYPVWTLFDASSSSTITVSGPELANLTINLDFVDPVGKTDTYILDFGAQVIETGNAGNVVYQYPMQWHAWDISNPAHPYCLDASSKEDNVVFQRGISVNPVTGAVTRSVATANVVTLSCRGGAIATVYDWGYDYLGAKLSWYFDAGIQMKRASYCADGHHYTKAGTKIEVSDDVGVRDQIPASTPAETLEAYWSPTGAKCIGKMRHPELGFTGLCNGQPLPACPSLASVQASSVPYLADMPAL